MATIRFAKAVNTLPGVLTANTLYMVAVGGETSERFDFYLTDSAGVASRHTMTDASVAAIAQDLIDSTLANYNDIVFVADIAARDALGATLTANETVFVIDATGDPTVTQFSATYIYRASNSTWYKISERESMDFVFSWANLLDKPTSSVAAIDQAVTNSHTHSNKTTLDKFSEGPDGVLFDGQPIRPILDTVAW